VRESVVRATCVEKGGRKGVLVKGASVDGLLRRAASGRSQGWGGGGSSSGMRHTAGLGRAPADHRDGRRPTTAREQRARLACRRPSKTGSLRWLPGGASATVRGGGG
jgi:hypothetical protein